MHFHRSESGRGWLGVSWRGRRPGPAGVRWGIGLAAGLLVASAAGFGVARWPKAEPAESLTYGQFRRELVEGRVRSVRVGPEEITGTLKADGSKGPRPFRASRIGMEPAEALTLTLAAHVPDGDYGAAPEPWATRETVVPIVLLSLILGVFVMAIRRSGGPSATALIRGRQRSYRKGQPRVTFDDVAGADEVVLELREVVDFLKTPEKFRAIGGRIPKGVLLSGPPGTGKTLLAKAVAGEAGVPFFAMSGSDFNEMYVGVGAARVRNLFAQAEARAPSLVFIDELDSIGKARGSGGSGTAEERDQTLNQLLVAMDGFDSGSGVIVMAATNRPETLDPALVRPGRFDRSVSVDRPNVDGREQILRVHARNVALDGSIDLRRIAAITSGFVGADLASLVNEAALLAARKGKQSVALDDFEQGVERVIAGPEKKQRVIRPEEKRRIAVHEAGHALVSLALPGTDPVHKVSILGRANGTLGYTMYRPDDDRFLHTQGWLMDLIRGLLGGTVAEAIVFDGQVSDGATSDLQRVSSIARKMVAECGMSPLLGHVSYQAEGRSPFLAGGGANNHAWSEQTAREIDLEVRRVVEEAYLDARSILESRRAALEAVADRLVDRETIDADELRDLLDRHPAIEAER